MGVEGSLYDLSSKDKGKNTTRSQEGRPLLGGRGYKPKGDFGLGKQCML